jgi:hypothetical protein
MHVKLLPAFGGPGYENENHFHNALRAKDLHIHGAFTGQKIYNLSGTLLACRWAKDLQNGCQGVGQKFHKLLTSA